MSSYNMPGTILGPGNIVVTKLTKIPFPHGAFIYWR